MAAHSSSPSAAHDPALRARPAAAAPPPAADRWPRLVLDLQAVLLNQPRSGPAAAAAVCWLAPALGARRVSVGWLQPNRQLTLLAASDGQGQYQADLATTEDSVLGLTVTTAGPDALLAAMGECVDQRASVLWPPAAAVSLAAGSSASRPRELPRISVAHRALSLMQACAVWTVPLSWRGEVLGALQIEWRDASAPVGVQLAAVENLAAWMAPVLGLMRANERPLHRRLRDAAQAWMRSDDRPERRPWRWVWPALAVVALVALAWPVAWHASGAARLEGGVQRVLSAPADGFIEKVHVRPGERVRAGQPLVDLADRDLLLERQRWQSQLAQQLEGHSAAQARADRAALAQHQAKADEAQAQLDLVEQRLARVRLVAPFDALVLQGDLSQQLGAPVKQGAELVTLAPEGQYRVVVAVDERDAARVAVGQTGSLALSALPWDAMPLTVQRISPVAKAVEGRNVFEVEAAVSAEAQRLLKPGLLGQARIHIGEAGLGFQWLYQALGSLRLWWWRWFP
ncbi:MAG: efflux RND transporter periplasmic adaptor subunit [Rubrivivax sp.]